ncbi:MAG: HutD family protein [Deltaproteobacteria bacterium]|nr:HutD family protein [Deltaproteobacteria bacterium]
MPILRHLTAADYTEQRWANGRGRTTELLRVERDGQLLLRLSMAMVAEDGDFSLFPDIERSLTVIAGPGFRLKGKGIDVRCLALVPVAFPGDVPVRAVGTRRVQSDDFGVMTARHLPRPQVTVEHDGSELPPGGLLALFALGDVAAAGVALARYDLLLTDGPADIRGLWPVIAVRVWGVEYG